MLKGFNRPFLGLRLDAKGRAGVMTPETRKRAKIGVATTCFVLAALNLSGNPIATWIVSIVWAAGSMGLLWEAMNE
jgi:hypothetical protein